MTNHIVLFLKPNININYDDLIKRLEESYKELGQGIVLSKDNTRPNQPNFIFNKNKDILIDGNNHHITINIFNEYTKIKNDIIEMLWDAFDYNELEFSRVGYIIESQNNIEDITNIKKKMLNNNLIEEIDEFQISYHNVIKFQRKNVNCWKRFIKFNSSPLIISYDINTKEDNFDEINYKTLKEFIDFSDKFIDEDINIFLKEK